MTVEETLSEMTTKKEPAPQGPPWTVRATCRSFEEAATERSKVREGYVKIRRRSDGTFTVLTRQTPPGGAKK